MDKRVKTNLNTIVLGNIKKFQVALKNRNECTEPLLSSETYDGIISGYQQPTMLISFIKLDYTGTLDVDTSYQ